jgi:hypothetical protein
VKTVKKATEIVKLINAVLFGVTVGLSVLRAMRETFNALAAEQEAKAKKAAK